MISYEPEAELFVGEHSNSSMFWDNVKAAIKLLLNLD